MLTTEILKSPSKTKDWIELERVKYAVRVIPVTDLSFVAGKIAAINGKDVEATVEATERLDRLTKFDKIRKEYNRTMDDGASPATVDQLRNAYLRRNPNQSVKTLVYNNGSYQSIAGLGTLAQDMMSPVNLADWVSSVGNRRDVLPDEFEISPTGAIKLSYAKSKEEKELLPGDMLKFRVNVEYAPYADRAFTVSTNVLRLICENGSMLSEQLLANSSGQKRDMGRIREKFENSLLQQLDGMDMHFRRLQRMSDEEYTAGEAEVWLRSCALRVWRSPVLEMFLFEDGRTKYDFFNAITAARNHPSRPQKGNGASYLARLAGVFTHGKASSLSLLELLDDVSIA